MLGEKDAEIHQLERDLADAVQNIQAHSMIVDANEKDAEIERLNAVIESQNRSIDRHLCIITELCDALDRSDPIQISIQEVANLLQRAWEATR